MIFAISWDLTIGFGLRHWGSAEAFGYFGRNTTNLTSSKHTPSLSICKLKVKEAIYGIGMWFMAALTLH